MSEWDQLRAAIEDRDAEARYIAEQVIAGAEVYPSTLDSYATARDLVHELRQRLHVSSA